jgi:photosystem II stability/assembly factor-like uncharacterized protein
MRPRTSIVGKLIALGALLSLAPTAAEAMSVQELAQHTHFHGLAVDPGDSSQLLLATHHGLFSVAQDGSVRQVSSGNEDFMGFSPHPSDGVTLYSSGHPPAGGNLGFRVSTDGGRTWTRLSPGAAGIADFHSMTVSPADPRTVYGSYGGLQVSRDGGASWSMVGPGPEGTLDLAASATDADLLYAGTSVGLMRSADGGKSWEPAHPAIEPVPMVAVAGDGSIYAYVLGTGLLRAEEPDLAWRTVGAGLGGRIIVHLAIDFKDPRHLFAVAVDATGHDPAILASADRGESWTEFGGTSD